VLVFPPIIPLLLLLLLLCAGVMSTLGRLLRLVLPARQQCCWGSAAAWS
jgi:hypothetical protein